MTLQTGSRIACYEIIGLLGEGGMGRVFEAEHVLLGRRAALKTLLTDLADDGEFRGRLLRESQAVASIDHPNIIPIYDAGDLDGTAYIAMRFVKGYDLATMTERRGALEPADALWILDQAGAALDAAHARRLVHRDVKPANILIEEGSGRVYLTDFGIVKEQGRGGGTRPGYFLGTIEYAAPEQIEGREIGPSADLYAFGCVLFECLAGSKPFAGATGIALMRAHVLESPPKLSAVRPGLPAALDAVLERALAKRPEDRYESCRALIEAARMALGVAGLPAPAAATASSSAFTEARPATTVETRLPAAATPLVGRERELGEAIVLLRSPSARLVTLTGFGGSGKTRLALAAAEALRDDYDSVVFVDLSAVREPELVAETLAQAIGCTELGDRSIGDAIRDRIGAAATLIVLDNFEQVVAAAPFVSGLLAASSSLRLLVTSQTPLRIAGEHEFPVPPLSLPAAEAGDLETLRRTPAVALFAERVLAVRPDFELTELNAAAVTEICRRLDGIPLAIELAAARMKLLTLQTLGERLGHRFELLTGGRADQPVRQQTLRAAIDWSVGLLDETERDVLARLGVFVGGSSLEAAEVVAGEPFSLGLGEMVDALTALVDKSLLRQIEAADGEPRFVMLETIREYALEQLEERGDARRVRELHAAHFLRLVETAEPELTRPNQAAWLERLDEEYGNVRAALAWSVEADETELALRFGSALVRYWSTRGYMGEGRSWLREAIADAHDAPLSTLADAEFALGYAALGLGEFADAESRFRRSLELAAGNPQAEAAARAQLAWIAMTSGSADDEAAALAEASLRGARELDDKRTASGALGTLAELALRRGDTTRAQQLHEESLALRRGLGDTRLIANSLLSLARVRLAEGDSERARQLFEGGLARAREIGDTWSASVALAGLGRLALRHAEPEAAADCFREALGLASARADKRAVADCLQGLAGVRDVEGSAGDAARLLGAADGLLDEIGATRTPGEDALDADLRPRLRSALGEDFEHEVDTGRGLALAEAVTFALGSAAR